jgi:hypothetical protein
MHACPLFAGEPAKEVLKKRRQSILAAIAGLREETFDVYDDESVFSTVETGFPLQVPFLGQDSRNEPRPKKEVTTDGEYHSIRFTVFIGGDPAMMSWAPATVPDAGRPQAILDSANRKLIFAYMVKNQREASVIAQEAMGRYEDDLEAVRRNLQWLAQEIQQDRPDTKREALAAIKKRRELHQKTQEIRRLIERS